MGRDDQRAIDAIVAVGRRTRKPTPRWLWIAAAIAGGIGVIGFAIAMLFPAPGVTHGRLAEHAATGFVTGATGSGFASGLAIGAAVGIAIGIWIGRQRLSHSSRNSP